MPTPNNQLRFTLPKSLRLSNREFASKESVSGIRTRGSRAIVSTPPATVTNGPPAIGEISVNATSGTSDDFPASGKSFRNGKYGYPSHIKILLRSGCPRNRIPIMS